MGPGDRLGRYELAEELGQGGMASVFRARDTELRRDVAVKVLHPHLAKRPQIVARFSREARAVAGLDHPHILRIFDVGAPGEEVDAAGVVEPPYIVMELVRGDNLRTFLLEHGPPLGEVVALVGAGLCAALAEAHAAGIVHRDVKPANVMVADGGRLVLTDFGVAHIADSDSVVTQTGALLGTPAFMSPEQALGEDTDARTDVYSLGATLYRLATGVLPFTGPAPKVMSAITRSDFASPLRKNPAMGAALSRVIETMMERDPKDRYPSMAEARAALLEVVATAGLEHAEQELAAYFDSPGEYTASRTPVIVAASLAAAKAAVDERSYPRAIDLADRVLALEPDHPDALALVDTISARGGRARWKIAAGVLALATVAGGAVGALWPRDPDPVAGPIAATDAGVADADTADAVVAAVIASVDAAAPVPVIPDAAPIRVVRRSPRRVDAAVAVAPQPDAAVVRSLPDAAPPTPATVVLALEPWCDVYIDGRPRGRVDPNHVYTLAPGVHVFRCTQGAGQPTWEKTVTLLPGQRREFRATLLAPVRVTVDVVAEAVRIRGKTYARGARVELMPGRYKVEVLSGGEVVQAGRVQLRSTVPACSLRDQPRLRCDK